MLGFNANMLDNNNNNNLSSSRGRETFSQLLDLVGIPQSYSYLPKEDIVACPRLRAHFFSNFDKFFADFLQDNKPIQTAEELVPILQKISSLHCNTSGDEEEDEIPLEKLDAEELLLVECAAMKKLCNIDEETNTVSLTPKAFRMLVKQQATSVVSVPSSSSATSAASSIASPLAKSSVRFEEEQNNNSNNKKNKTSESENEPKNKRAAVLFDWDQLTCIKTTEAATQFVDAIINRLHKEEGVHKSLTHLHAFGNTSTFTGSYDAVLQRLTAMTVKSHVVSSSKKEEADRELVEVLNNDTTVKSCDPLVIVSSDSGFAPEIKKQAYERRVISLHKRNDPASKTLAMYASESWFLDELVVVATEEENKKSKSSTTFAAAVAGNNASQHDSSIVKYSVANNNNNKNNTSSATAAAGGQQQQQQNTSSAFVRVEGSFYRKTDLIPNAALKYAENHPTKNTFFCNRGAECDRGYKCTFVHARKNAQPVPSSMVPPSDAIIVASSVEILPEDQLRLLKYYLEVRFKCNTADGSVPLSRLAGGAAVALGRNLDYPALLRSVREADYLNFVPTPETPGSVYKMLLTQKGIEFLKKNNVEINSSYSSSSSSSATAAASSSSSSSSSPFDNRPLHTVVSDVSMNENITVLLQSVIDNKLPSSDPRAASDSREIALCAQVGSCLRRNGFNGKFHDLVEETVKRGHIICCKSDIPGAETLRITARGKSRLTGTSSN